MRILITGATSGIGKELAQRYAMAGHQVVACGRDESKLKQLSATAPDVQTLCFDLTDFDSYQNQLKDTEALDLIIFNAGDCEYIDNPMAFDAKAFQRIININLIAVGYGLQAWVKHVNPGGRIVFVSSSSALLPLPRAEAYGSSKAALSYLASTLSITLAPKNIAVTLVHPGFVETPLTDKNTFPMPMIISPQKAVTTIISGIEQGKRVIEFPRSFILILKLMRLLPAALWQRIAKRMI